MTWYAFTCSPQLERRAWDGLEKIMIEPARLDIPRIYRPSSGRGRRTIMRPLIPGYALGNVSGHIPWPAIRMIEWQGRPIIHDVLRAGSIPAAIPAGEVERLTAYLSETDHAGPGALRPGAKARISIGRHDDQQAVIKRVLSESKCTVMMRWFGSDREVSTSVDRVRAAG